MPPLPPLLPLAFHRIQSQSWWGGRWGSPQAPIVLTSLTGDPTSVTVPQINMFNCTHVYMLGFTIASTWFPFHCELCVWFHMRNMRVLSQFE